MAKLDDCHVCSQFCTADGTRCLCFACGLHACSECTRRMNYHRFGVRRICFHCIEEQFKNGSEIVQKIYERASY